MKNKQDSQNELFDKVIAKINRLIQSGEKIEFIPSGRDNPERIRIDKFIVSQELIQSGTSSGYQYFVYLDFYKYPILHEPEAAKVYALLNDRINQVIKDYLND